MENIYEWLCDHYAVPRLESLPEFQDQRTEPLLAMAPEDQRLSCSDALVTLQMNWCTAAFELGVRLGVELKAAESGKYGG